MRLLHTLLALTCLLQVGCSEHVSYTREIITISPEAVYVCKSACEKFGLSLNKVAILGDIEESVKLVTTRMRCNAKVKCFCEGAAGDGSPPKKISVFPPDTVWSAFIEIRTSTEYKVLRACSLE